MSSKVRRTLELLLLSAAGVFLALHFVHLKADFPNHSPWIDWAKYTDEGWYGDGAIRHYLRGTWRLPGDFNPAAALPVWPLLEAFVFRFTGVGIVAARALAVVVFAAILIAAYFLLRAPSVGEETPDRRLWSSLAIFLLALSPFVYVFSRMAILEPLLILLTLLSLLTALTVSRTQPARRRLALSVVLGVLIALMIGTKTTALFLLPAIIWMLWSSPVIRSRDLLRSTLVAASTTLVLSLAYLGLLVHWHLIADFRYLFEANQYTGSTLGSFGPAVWTTLRNGVWLGRPLYTLFAVAVVFSLFRRGLWRDRVFTSLALWTGGYLFFLAYHANAQPRYYLVIAVPITLLVVRALEHLAKTLGPAWNIVLFALLFLVAALDASRTLHYVLHPEYSFLSAAAHVGQVVESEPNHSHVVLSISGSDLSLMTGLPSICDDFGTMDLEDRIAAYHPGWFVAWNYVEDDKMEALAKFYRLTRVAAFPAMDDPDRNLLIVYRLDPKGGAHPRRRRNRVPPAGNTANA